MRKPRFRVGQIVKRISYYKIGEVLAHGGQHPYYTYKLNHNGWVFEDEIKPQRERGPKGVMCDALEAARKQESKPLSEDVRERIISTCEELLEDVAPNGFILLKDSAITAEFCAAIMKTVRDARSAEARIGEVVTEAREAMKEQILEYLEGVGPGKRSDHIKNIRALSPEGWLERHDAEVARQVRLEEKFQVRLVDLEPAKAEARLEEAEWWAENDANAPHYGLDPKADCQQCQRISALRAQVGKEAKQ